MSNNTRTSVPVTQFDNIREQCAVAAWHHFMVPRDHALATG
jgi:hypothetical protein